MDSLRGSRILPSLLALLWCGCGPKMSKHPDIDPVLREVVMEYWNAVMEPEWKGDPRTLPNCKKAYELLHPEAKAALTLEQFNRREWERVRAHGGSLWQATIEKAKTSENSASVTMKLHFGQPGDFGLASRATTQLKKNGERWAVFAVEDE